MKLAIYFSMAVILSGCASGYKIKSGNPLFTPENIQKVTNGMTRAEVSQILGSPETKSDMPPLGEMWVYSGSELQSKTTHLFAPTQQSGVVRAATIMFDQSGRVSQISKTETNPYQQVSISAI